MTELIQVMFIFIFFIFVFYTSTQVQNHQKYKYKILNRIRNFKNKIMKYNIQQKRNYIATANAEYSTHEMRSGNQTVQNENPEAHCKFKIHVIN